MIGILRYGGNFAKLPSLGYIATDTDIDIMIRMESDTQWNKWVPLLSQEILKLNGFQRCQRHYAANLYSTQDKLTCYTNSDIFGENIHTDIHRYIVDNENNYAYTNTNNDDLRYPFQHWNNKIPYKGMITDENGYFKKALFHKVIVPCPYRASEILQYWNGGEYSHGQIALPAGGVIKKDGQYKFVDDRLGNFELSEDDIEFIKEKSQFLYTNGFECFFPHYLTVVSSFIEITSKHTKNEYRDWMKNLLSYKGPMIIFVDSKNIDYITKLRYNLPTKIILTELKDLSTNKYKGRFNHHLGTYYIHDKMHNKMDLDEYSMIQNEKPHFLKRAKDMNVFNTPYYMWLDIGYLRTGTNIPKDWPNSDKLQIMNNKIILMSLTNNKCLKEEDTKVYTYDNPPNNVLITGGIIGSHKNNIDLFHKLFYTKLEKIIQDKKEWAGMDQFILSHIYCENPDSFFIIEAKQHNLVENNPWFYGIPFFL